MLVHCTLEMLDVTVENVHYDSIEIRWTETMSEDELLEASKLWLTQQGFLTRRMMGLQRIGESGLVLHPEESL